MRRLARCTLSLVFLALLVAPALGADPPATIDPDEIEAGMTGYGLSVFSGTGTERFEVQVIDVIRNYFPHQDMILIRCSGQGLEHSGIVAGMSGSPIYVQDRLAGALAYGWGYSKDPIAGVTPIQNMLAELDRPRVRVGWRPPVFGDGALQPCRSPLFLGGFHPNVLDHYAETFERMHLLPLQGGGGGIADPGTAPEGPPFEPGSAVGVQLLSGDWNMTAIGTVTWAHEDHVLAFGHPFFGGGESAMPMTTARIHLILARQSTSFKMGSPIAAVGGMIQDRQSCIVGELTSPPSMIPITLHVSNAATAQEKTFHFAAIRHKYYTPLLIQMAVANGIETAEAENEDNTVRTTMTLVTAGHGRLERTDWSYANTSLAGSSIAGTLLPLFMNPWERFSLDSVEVRVEVLPDHRYATIRSIRLDGAAPVTPGETASLVVELERFDGKRSEHPLAFPVPLETAGTVLNVVVTGGEGAPFEVPSPEGVDDLIDLYRRQWRANQVVATIQGPEEFRIEVGGSHLKGLPLSALGVLNPARASVGEVQKDTNQTSIEVPWIVDGAAQLAVPVRSR